MENDNQLEIYKQRYETFRHLDRIRWQLFQILIAIGSAVALVLRVSSGPLDWWFWGLLAVSLSVLGFSMMKVGAGIRANGIVLRQFGEKVGDKGIPDVGNEAKSIAHWIAVFVLLLSLVFWVLMISHL